MLLANPELDAGGYLSKSVTSLNDKVCRAKNRCGIGNLSIDEISAKYVDERVVVLVDTDLSSDLVYMY